MGKVKDNNKNRRRADSRIRPAPGRNKPAAESHSRLPIFYIYMAAVTLLVSFLIGDRLLPVGVPGEWQWAFYETDAYPLWGFPAFALVAALFGVVMLHVRLKENRWITAGALAALIILSLALHGVASRISPGGPHERIKITVSPWIGGYYLESMTIDQAGRDALRQSGIVREDFFIDLEEREIDGTADYLAVFDERISGFAIDDPLWGHLSDHPAGPVLAHVLTRRITAASPGLAKFFWSDDDQFELRREIDSVFADPTRRGRTGFISAMWLTGFIDLPREEKAAAVASVWLFRLFAALTLLPVYLLCREMFPRGAALKAAAIAAIIPALHLFSPYPDLALPLFAALFVYFFQLAARSGKAWWGAAAGLAFFIGLQFSLSLLVAGFMAAVAAGVYLYLGRRKEQATPLTPKRLAVISAGGLAGFLIPALALALFLDYDVFRVWYTCYSTHATFAETFSRTYWKWVIAGPVEGALFAGVPLVMLFFRRIWRDIKERRLFNRPDVLLWSIFITLFVLNISGKSLGEVGRLWMFLMPLGAAVAAAEIEEEPHSSSVLALVLFLMALQTLWFRSALNVFGTGL